MSETDSSAISQPIFEEAASTYRAQTYQWKPAQPLALAVSGAIILHVTLNLVQGVGTVWRLRVVGALISHTYSSGPAMMVEARSSDQFVRYTTALGLLGLLVCYVLASMWIYRVASNARALGARRLSSKPGWAVGWYAVPGMSFFRPFLDMTEIWKASHAPLTWSSARTPRLLAFWWAAWVLTSIAGSALSAAAVGSHTLSGLMIASRIQLAEKMIDTTAAILFLAVVWRLTNAQAKTRREIETSAEVFA